jgi:hypothetical protein
LSQKTIEILVSPTGKVSVETKGFAGSGCQAASEFLVSALGQTIQDARTAEYYQQPIQQSAAREGA